MWKMVVVVSLSEQRPAAYDLASDTRICEMWLWTLAIVQIMQNPQYAIYV